MPIDIGIRENSTPDVGYWDTVNSYLTSEDIDIDVGMVSEYDSPTLRGQPIEPPRGTVRLSSFRSEDNPYFWLIRDIVEKPSSRKKSLANPLSYDALISRNEDKFILTIKLSDTVLYTEVFDSEIDAQNALEQVLSNLTTSGLRLEYESSNYPK